MSRTIVIAGAGQAGAQTALSLRQEGFDGRIVLLGAEEALPYQRPPLSKAFLSGQVDESGIALRAANIFLDQRIELLLGRRVTAINRGNRTIATERDGSFGYDHLVLALGVTNRALTVPGATLQGVRYLRTLDEARALRESLPSLRNIVVIGAGFIGLEFAAVARKAGIAVHVVEAAPRPMARAVSEPVSAFYEGLHRAHGVELTLNACVTRFVPDALGEKVAAVELADGRQLPADLVLAGIGVLPNTELAERAGLAVRNGILVNEFLVTSDPDISAVGDCVQFPTRFDKDTVRLESVQNAVDQARCIAARLQGKAAPYVAVPWFWSDQYDAKLQIAGLTARRTRTVVKGDPAAGSFSVFSFEGDAFLGVESVNRPSDHMAARKILAKGTGLTPGQLDAPEFDIKAFAAAS
ncbi:NAD(P)/FAD-dependent oxidoreductase [Noviherbaspirillum denitrificans]|uniref:Pyridine nucleotide-disulfide oxidoreductase n=1 Tax=Noviherbaspirillum denitrificans TaxID=1968433 RepID=A0A254T7U4_9BURK|nr:FAD-dependent oxidoreductase [Noviherbaspirillum denitrificans]OWW18720.1 pyridine nucleotide-disulfide oxidoreductase [Noviherbaspirillum denitrificans]